jgi:formate hydrogenlyase subunit 3/multisubunit Na+/H+ antiporter MnhD subunit
VAWALLSGVPPSPAFWGRLLLLEALAAGNVGSTIAAVIAIGAIFIAAVLACAPRPRPVRTPAVPERRARPRPVKMPALPERLSNLAAWLLVALGIAIGLAPQSLAGFVFGH